LISDSKHTHTYRSLAPIYDRVMAHVDYHQWISLITGVVRKYGKTQSPSIFEIGGGTGNLGQKLTEQGFRYQGSDYSYAMCREARKKNLPFFVADARNLPCKVQFDLILFLYDGINYLGSAQEYSALLDNVWQMLKPDGLFLFDITTIANSQRNFINFIDYEDLGDHVFVRHSHFNSSQELQYNRFIIFSQSEQDPSLYKKTIESHAQKVFPAQTIRSFIPVNQFAILGIWDGYGFFPYSKRSERIHFLIQKRSGI
jgi:SAM-dependent methyltransferase